MTKPARTTAGDMDGGDGRDDQARSGTATAPATDCHVLRVRRIRVLLDRLS
jgi:hypothetical protein